MLHPFFLVLPGFSFSVLLGLLHLMSFFLAMELDLSFQASEFEKLWCEAEPVPVPSVSARLSDSSPERPIDSSPNATTEETKEGERMSLPVSLPLFYLIPRPADDDGVMEQVMRWAREMRGPLNMPYLDDMPVVPSVPPVVPERPEPSKPRPRGPEVPPGVLRKQTRPLPVSCQCPLVPTVPTRQTAEAQVAEKLMAQEPWSAQLLSWLEPYKSGRRRSRYIFRAKDGHRVSVILK